MKKIFFFALVFLLGGCATVGKNKTESAQFDLQQKFFFTQARELELAPCGCSANPKGGVERQLEYFKQNRVKEDWYFAMGPAFSPDPKLYYPKLQKKFEEKAEALSKAFKNLELQYLGLTANDAIWPQEKLEKWQVDSGFSWVSANIRFKKAKKLNLKTAVFLDERKKVLLTSVSDLPPRELKRALDFVEVDQPEKTLLKLIQDQKEVPEVVIVLTNIPKDRADFSEKDFGVPVFFLGPTQNLELEWEQKTKRNFWAAAAPRAQAVLSGKIGFKEGAQGFYFEKQQSNLKEFLKTKSSDPAFEKEVRSRLSLPEDRLFHITDLWSIILSSRWEPQEKK